MESRIVSTDPAVCGVLLAGGLARRMGGGDKPLLLLDGRPLLAHAIARLAPQCGRLAINANGDPARFATFGLPVIADSVANYAGPLAGVLAGMDYAAGQWPQMRLLLSAPADTPFPPADLVVRLKSAMENTGARIAVASSGDRTHHAIALWQLSLREALRGALTQKDERKVSAFIARYPNVSVDWPVAPFDPFFNVNRPEDLHQAGAIAEQDS
jgi:molybdopterin-guanine dinucleotide biosynthesis protein A